MRGADGSGIPDCPNGVRGEGHRAYLISVPERSDPSSPSHVALPIFADNESKPQNSRAAGLEWTDRMDF